MTNFVFLTAEPQFASFAPAAVAAEKILHIDPAACVLNCHRAMESAVKWMYTADSELVMPCQDTLISLMTTEEFRDIVGQDIYRRMGNNAAHTGKAVTTAQARLCLENLYVFRDFVACCYAGDYSAGQFDPTLWQKQGEPASAPPCRWICRS